MRPKAPTHGRIKPKYNSKPNAAEVRFREHVRLTGCLVCGSHPPSIHHVTSDGGKRLTRNHWHVTPLCWEHHQGNTGIHMLGHNKFVEMHGINLHDEGLKILEHYTR